MMCEIIQMRDSLSIEFQWVGRKSEGEETGLDRDPLIAMLPLEVPDIRFDSATGAFR